MNTYDFQKIFSPMEFQDFARDMLQVREGVVFESFAEGRDLGIDNRYISPEGDCWILQAKRWKDAGPLPVSELRAEREKLDRLKPKPDRYYLVTSRELSPLQKDRIREIFAPYIQRREDIITGRDLNNYLGDESGRYKGVGEKYFKLWIQNTEVLKRVLQDTVHSALLEESSMELRRIRRNSGAFVETAVYQDALRKLERNKVLIISGEPGMGKTTLAGQLGLYFCLKREYSAFLWISQVDDLYTSCQIGTKSVIIFDDFWGSSFFEKKKAGREEERLARFMEETLRGEDCVLILTTREYILEQGLKQHENIRRLIERYKIECRLRSYTDNEKAEIYLSHLCQSDLRPDQLRRLFGIHGTIVNSENYNPRVIETFLQTVNPEEPPGACERNFLKYLRNPVDFWQKVFSDLSAEAKALYIILYTFPDKADDHRLRECYVRVIPLLGGAMECKTFGEALAELEKTVTWTEPSGYRDILIVKFQNPSVREFMGGYLGENLEQYYDIMAAGCICTEQYLAVLRLCQERGICGVKYAELMRHAAEEIEKEDPRCWYETFFQLVGCYRPDCCGELELLFQRKMEEVRHLIRCHPLRIPGDMVPKFVSALEEACDRRLVEDPREMFESYMDTAVRLLIPPETEWFVNRYPEIWESYENKNRDRLRAFYGRYHRGELCVSALEGNSEEFDFLYAEYEEMLDQLGWDRIPEVETSVLKYGAWLTTEPVEEPEYGYKGKDDSLEYKQVIALYETELFDSEDRFEVFDAGVLKNYLGFYQISETAERQLCDIEREGGPWFWEAFFYRERTLQFMLELAEREGMLCDSLKDGVDQVFGRLSEICGRPEAQLEEILLYIGAQKDFVKSEALLSFHGFSDMDDIVLKLGQSGVLVKSGNWYGLAADIFYIMARARQIGGMSDSARKEMYVRVLSDTPEVWEERELLKAFLEMDGRLFENCLFDLAAQFLKPYRHMEEQQALECLLSDLDFSLDLDSDFESTGCGYSGPQILELLECLELYAVMDLLPEKVEPELAERLKIQGILREAEFGGYCEVRINDIQDREIVRAMGIYDGLKDMWEYLNALAKGGAGDAGK